MKTVYKHCDQCNTLHDASAWPHEAQIDAKYDPSAGYDDYMSGPRSGRFLNCSTCGGIHETSHWPHNCMPEQFDVAHEYAGIATISDSLESLGGLNGIQNQADGRFYTSKAKLRADYRARGVIEMGNDKPAKFVKPRPDRKKIKEALHRSLSMVNNEGATAANFRARSKTKTAFGRVAAK